MRKIFSQCQGIIRRQRQMEKLIKEEDFLGAFGIRPVRTPNELREERNLPQPSMVFPDGGRAWTFN